MNKKPDRRVERTKQALRTALVELILEKGYEAISVQDMVERANIGRSTFYMHYSAKDAVFLDAFRPLERALQATLAQGGAGRMRYVTLLFQHVDMDRRLYRALAGERGGELAVKHIRKILFDLVQKDFASRPHGKPHSKTTSNAAEHFTVTAIIGVLTWWLDHNPHWGSEEVEHFLHKMLAPGLDQIFADDAKPAP